jgi:hypothetical protein
VALAGQGEAHAPRLVGVEAALRRPRQRLRQLVLGEPGELLRRARFRLLALGEEGDRARAVAAQLGDQRVAVAGVDAQLMRQPAPPRPARQQPLDVDAGLLGPVRLRARRQRQAEPRPLRPQALDRPLVVGEDVTVPLASQRCDPRTAQMDVQSHGPLPSLVDTDPSVLEYL